MTNAEAIKWLRLQMSKGIQWDDYSVETHRVREEAENRIKEAYAKAIEALERDEPRVMNFDEVGFAAIGWVEFKGRPETGWVRIDKYNASGRLALLASLDKIFYQSWDSYGSAFRLWTNPPDDERRRMEAWDA